VATAVILGVFSVPFFYIFPSVRGITTSCQIHRYKWFFVVWYKFVLGIEP